MDMDIGIVLTIGGFTAGILWFVFHSISNNTREHRNIMNELTLLRETYAGINKAYREDLSSITNEFIKFLKENK